MSFIKNSTKIAGVLGAAALAFTLTACSGGQSVAEACKIAEDTVSQANTEMETLMADAMGGDSNMSELFAPIQQAFSDAEKNVSNADVSKALKDVNSEFSSMIDVLGDFKIPDMSNIDYSDPEAMAEIEDMQAELEAASAELEESAANMQAAGKRLEELCNA